MCALPVVDTRESRYPLAMRPSVLCRLASVNMWRAIEPHLTHLSIDFTRYQILSLLDDGRLSHDEKELHFTTSVEHALFAEAVLDLKDRGLINRYTIGGVAVLHITEVGSSVLEAATCLSLESGVWNDVFHGFSEAEVSSLLTLLAKLARVPERRKRESEKVCNSLSFLPLDSARAST